MRADTLDERVRSAARQDRCSAFDGNVPCGGPAVRVGVAGCVHEHVKTVAHCVRHVRAVGDNTMRCRECLLAGHMCILDVIYR